MIQRKEASKMEKQIAFKALVGSHNYNLNQEGSDKDYKVFLIPSSEDVAELKKSRMIKRAKEDVTHHNIHQLKDLLIEGNVNFLEVLFSEDLEFGNSLEAGAGAYLMELFEYREEIARMNLPGLYTSCLAFFNSQFNALRSRKKDELDYNTKQAMHCARILDVLIRYERQGFNDFKSALWFSDGEPEKIELERIKAGAYTKEEMLIYLTNKKAYVQEVLKPIYSEQVINKERSIWVMEQIMLFIQLCLD